MMNGLAMAITQLEIVAIKHTLTPRAPKGWLLEVVWQFRNPAEHPLYVLSESPLWIRDEQPVVLNHTVANYPIGLDPNIDPAMKFVAVVARDSLDLHRCYPLPPIDLHTARAVVGWFAVGYRRPDPEWTRDRIWDAVKRWQQVLRSPSFTIRAPAE